MKRKRHWSWLVLGFVLTATATCRPVDEDDPILESVEPTSTSVTVTTLASGPTETPAPQPWPTDTISPPLLPTAEPTVIAPDILFKEWIQVGGEASALEIAAPPDWVNISSRINVPDATRRLGLIVFLMADSERTGNSILAGKEVSSGAFSVGLVSHLNWSSEDPVGALTELLGNLGTSVSVLNPPAPITTPRSADGPPVTSPPDEAIAASVDITGDPIGLFSTGESNLRSRLLLIPYGTRDGISSDDRRDSQAILLMSAPATQWDLYSEIFTYMADTFVTHRIRSGFVIGDGVANYMGLLRHMEPINGKLDKNIRDIWSFTTERTGYATLTLSPTDKDIDLSMVVIGPSGFTIARIDNGYAGDAEVAADLLLVEEGTYIIEIGEFFSDSGRYTLNLSLGDGPLFDGKGRIAPGQGIQSELSDGARHVWSFAGTAGELVSIILSPGHDQFDAILDLYDPEGTRLVGLDEGFSGDAEVISGFELPVTGEYSILVRSFAGNGGTYALSLDEGGEVTRNFFDAGSLANGDVKEMSLRDDEAHAWFIDGRVGDVILVEVAPLDESLDLELWLLDPDVSRLAVEDRFASGEGESIEMPLSRDGQFLILVRDFYGETGDYKIEFTSRMGHAPVEAGELSFGVAVIDTLAAGQSALWQFWGEVDDIIDVELAPLDGNADMVLVLQDPLANTVLEIDAELAGASEAINGFTITADGQWRVLVKEFFNDQGSYTLTIERSRR